MIQAPMNVFRVSLVALTAVVAVLPAESVQAGKKSATYEGKPVALGQGTARTVVRTDAKGKPVSIGVILTASALEGLSTGAGSAGHDDAYLLTMPTKGPKTVVEQVVLNWQSAGHPPPGVYDVPHFDFHFYLVSHAERMKVAFGSDSESGDPSQQPPAELMPSGYVMPPGTAVSKMGAHAINPASPEFHGEPFTVTLIYGYYNKQQTFIEPMVSLAFLISKQAYSAPVPRPANYSKAGAFPSSFNVKYDPGKMSYEVSLGELR